MHRRVDQHLVPGGGFLRLRPALAQHPVQKLIVYRLGAEQIRRGVGDEGHHGQGQHVGQRSRHFTDEQYAGHWRPYHRREISRHAQNYEILQMYVQPDGGRRPAHQAARHRAQHQQRQENPARHPRAEAEDGICEPDGQQTQQPQQGGLPGETRDKPMAAAQDGRPDKAQDSRQHEGNGGFDIGNFDFIVQVLCLVDAQVIQHAEQAENQPQHRHQPVVFQRHHGDARKIKNRLQAEYVAGNHVRRDRGGHGRQQHIQREVLVQLLQGKEHPGQRRVEGRSQPRAGPAGHQQFFLGAHPLGQPGDPFAGHGAQLDGGPLPAQRQPCPDGQQAT